MNLGKLVRINISTDHDIILIPNHAGEIEPSQSLFTYPEGLTASNFSYPQHEPVFLDEVIHLASEEILQLCGDNAECIFDAIQTGNTDVALDTLQTDTTNSNDQMITCKFAITIASMVNASAIQ